jgi:HSP20 family protein
MLLRVDPFRELDRLANGIFSGGPRPSVPMDAYKLGDRFIVHLDLPGVDGKNIDLSVVGSTVTIRAERAWQPGQGVDVIVAKRPHGSFTRQLFLDDGLDVGRIAADYADCVLTLTIPLAEGAKPRKVAIGQGCRQKAIETSSTEASSSN